MDISLLEIDKVDIECQLTSQFDLLDATGNNVRNDTLLLFEPLFELGAKKACSRKRKSVTRNRNCWDPNIPVGAASAEGWELPFCCAFEADCLFF